MRNFRYAERLKQKKCTQESEATGPQDEVNILTPGTN